MRGHNRFLLKWKISQYSILSGPLCMQDTNEKDTHPCLGLVCCLKYCTTSNSVLTALTFIHMYSSPEEDIHLEWTNLIHDLQDTRVR